MKKSIVLIAIFCLIVFPLAGMAEEGATRANDLVNAAPVDVSGSLLKVIVGLFLVVVAIFASAWFYRRFGNVSSLPTQSLKIVGGLNMGSREKIVLVQVGDQQILVGVTANNINPLHVLDKPIETETVSPVSGNFAEKLNLAMKQWKAR